MAFHLRALPSFHYYRAIASLSLANTRARAIPFAHHHHVLASICVKYFRWVYFILFRCLPEFKVIYKTDTKCCTARAQIVYTASNWFRRIQIKHHQSVLILKWISRENLLFRSASSCYCCCSCSFVFFSFSFNPISIRLDFIEYNTNISLCFSSLPVFRGVCRFRWLPSSSLSSSSSSAQSGCCL